MKKKAPKLILGVMTLTFLLVIAVIIINSLRKDKEIIEYTNELEEISYPVSFVEVPVEELAEEVEDLSYVQEKEGYVWATKFYSADDTAIPDMIKNLEEKDLRYIGCSALFREVYPFQGEFENEQKVRLEDQNVLEFIKTRTVGAQDRSDPNAIAVGNIINCIASNTAQLYITNEKFPGVASGGTATITLVENGVTQVLQTQSPSPNPYWSCNKVLTYTKQNALYIQCGGGDGGYRDSFIFKADFENNIISREYWCSSRYNFDTKESTTSCE